MSVASLNTGIEKKTVTARRLLYSTSALIGYVLSPLSWWNDLIVNVPLAMIIAGVLNHITGLDMNLLFIVSYWLTNIIGMVMMITGGAGALKGRVTRRDVLVSIAVSMIYTLAVVVVLDGLSLAG
ncbi:MAG: hypothetical protein GSR78_01580 [Desulfurococcales archaeon]|nr:hypothetical protein [Desulfurococcales archaeon]